ncbi:MAG: hypothetical protein ACYTG1_05835 [Planctomycetota bacterium]|jgi:GMP synthase-like glutamine amidotransferase
MRVLLIQCGPVESLDLFERGLVERGHRVDVARADRGQRVPSGRRHDAVVAGGVPLSAAGADADADAARAAERQLGRLAGAGRPLLALGGAAALAARALGATLEREPEVEVGFDSVHLTDDGAGDPVFAGVPASFPALHWRRVRPGLPAGARHLARADGWDVQAWRRGRVVGCLFHVELTSWDVARWADLYDGERAASGHSRLDLEEACQAREPQMHGVAECLLENLLELAGGSSA